MQGLQRERGVPEGVQISVLPLPSFSENIKLFNKLWGYCPFDTRVPAVPGVNSSLAAGSWRGFGGHWGGQKSAWGTSGTSGSSLF